MKKKFCVIFIACCAGLLSCRNTPVITPVETEPKGEAQHNAVAGFYLLNEGNMGSNKATLDYYDYTNATYQRNIYASANPDVPMSLGDVGNDLQIYGSRLYAVINCSNKVEVMDARTGVRIGQIDVPNCRYLRFQGQYGYVTSYAGPVTFDPNYEQVGYVARFDTATLQIVDQCLVGYQPEELEIVGDKMFVANSGGYMAPNYDHTLSIIDLNTFTETGRIDVAINLHHVRADKYGKLWVTSRGDYYDEPSRLFMVDATTEMVEADFPVAVSDIDIVGDSLYFYASEWSYFEMRDIVTFGIFNVQTQQIVSENFIADGTEQNIQKPYGIKVNPVTKEILLTDAKDYVTPGALYCFAPDGVLKWSVRTGDIPAHIAFCPINFTASSDPSSPSNSSNPYISKVWEYCPAPGQFINVLPKYEEGDDAEKMRQKAEEAIANNRQGMICLGSWGGYVTFGFDHMVPNVPGEYDFVVLGNAFYAGNAEDEHPKGSCEPGIIMVSYDANDNGRPDDEWYEIAGSEYNNPLTLHNYTYTYLRADTSHRNPYHTQPYFPQWLDADSLTFTGTRLPDNYVDESGNGTYYVLSAYPWGYADNHPNTSEKAQIKIDWAVREDGTPANLPGIHFVKVYTGLHQYCGQLGETSTEITGATDLHCTTVN